MPRSMRDRLMRRKDRRMRRDGRNPYGSEGGYVTSRKSKRDRGMDYASRSYRNDNAQYGSNDYNYEYSEQDYARGGRNSQSNRQYDMAGYNGNMRNPRDGHYPIMPNYNDYAYGDYDEGEMLTDEDLMDWSKELLEEVEEPHKSYFTKENIERKMKEMHITEDDFTFAELYTTALMLYDDYKATLGKGNLDIYVKLAKDWLMDKDAEIQGGEKLAVYYDNIVCPE